MPSPLLSSTHATVAKCQKQRKVQKKQKQKNKHENKQNIEHNNVIKARLT